MRIQAKLMERRGKNAKSNKVKRLFLFKTHHWSLFLLLLVCVTFLGCKKTYIPRPYGYFRVYLPEHGYRIIDTLDLPYRFGLSDIAVVQEPREKGKYWIDIVYPDLNAKIHGSYMDIDGDVFELTEDTREFVYTHTSKADGINERFFENEEESVYGILYELKGNVASSIQFVLTDSIHHFFRGALYFNNTPNKDSISPMLNYIREDIIELIETFEWKK